MICQNKSWNIPEREISNESVWGSKSGSGDSFKWYLFFLTLKLWFEPALHFVVMLSVNATHAEPFLCWRIKPGARTLVTREPAQKAVPCGESALGLWNPVLPKHIAIRIAFFSLTKVVAKLPLEEKKNLSWVVSVWGGLKIMMQTYQLFFYIRRVTKNE